MQSSQVIIQISKKNPRTFNFRNQHFSCPPKERQDQVFPQCLSHFQHDQRRPHPERPSACAVPSNNFCNARVARCRDEQTPAPCLFLLLMNRRTQPEPPSRRFAVKCRMQPSRETENVTPCKCVVSFDPVGGTSSCRRRSRFRSPRGESGACMHRCSEAA